VAILPPPAVTRKPVKVAGAAKGKPVAQAKPRYRPAELMRAVTPNGADARTQNASSRNRAIPARPKFRSHETVISCDRPVPARSH